MLTTQRPVPVRHVAPGHGLETALELLSAAAEARARDGLLLDRPTASADPTWLRALQRTDRHEFDLAVDHAVRDAGHVLLCHGWRPGELLAFAAHRFGDATVGYLADTLGLTAQYSAAVEWLVELDALGCPQWWTTGESHAAQWASRTGATRDETTAVAIDALAVLRHLPRTAAAQPETPAASGVSAGALVRDSAVTRRVDALFSRVVGTTFAHEAEACAAKAQELLLRHARLPRISVTLPARLPLPVRVPLAVRLPVRLIAPARMGRRVPSRPSQRPTPDRPGPDRPTPNRRPRPTRELTSA